MPVCNFVLTHININNLQRHSWEYSSTLQSIRNKNSQLSHQNHAKQVTMKKLSNFDCSMRVLIHVCQWELTDTYAICWTALMYPEDQQPLWLSTGPIVTPTTTATAAECCKSMFRVKYYVATADYKFFFLHNIILNAVKFLSRLFWILLSVNMLQMNANKTRKMWSIPEYTQSPHAFFVNSEFS